MASRIPEIFCAFGPQLNAFMSVGILLKYFRRKLLQFQRSKTMSNIGMSCFISGTGQVVFRCFFYKSPTFLHSKFHICGRLTAFPKHCKKKIVGYIWQRVHFQLRVSVFNRQQILTKIYFVVFYALMLQQFSPMPKRY